jgi:hypothetical protein
MSIRKPKAILELVFRGPGIVPEKIPIGKVAGALSAVKRLASGEIVGEEDEDEGEDSADPIRLIGLGRGSSAVFSFVGTSPSLAIANLREAGRVLENPDVIGQPNEYVLRPIKDLSAIARALDCSIILKEVGDSKGVLATIESKSYDRISKSLLLEGETSVTGTVMRVGGATYLRCGLRVSFQRRMLFCRVISPEVARALGNLLYQGAVLRGKAKWWKSSMRIFSFEIQEVNQPKPGSILDGLDAVWDAGLKDWERIDNPDAYLQEIRGEG